MNMKAFPYSIKAAFLIYKKKCLREIVVGLCFCSKFQNEHCLRRAFLLITFSHNCAKGNIRTMS